MPLLASSCSLYFSHQHLQKLHIIVITMEPHINEMLTDQTAGRTMGKLSARTSRVLQHLLLIFPSCFPLFSPRIEYRLLLPLMTIAHGKYCQPLYIQNLKAVGLINRRATPRMSWEDELAQKTEVFRSGRSTHWNWGLLRWGWGVL